MGILKCRVEVRLRKFLRTEAEREIVRGKQSEGVFRDGGLAATGRTGHDHDLRALHVAQQALDNPVARQMKVGSNRRANVAEHEGAVLAKKTENLLLCVASDRVPFPQRGRQILSREASCFRDSTA